MEKSTMYMKFSTIVLFLIGFSVLFNLTFFEPANKGEITLPAQEGVAVIELFTSQGCSSCPSADRLLSQLIDQAETNELPVYGLSFHVDYWNRLGWKDPYSQKAFTQRQYDYARQMRQQGVYTPQMVVNGSAEFVGSNRGRAISEIEKAKKAGEATEIEVTQVSIQNETLTLTYESPEATVNTWLNVALVERDIATQVNRGENRGRLLEHDNVVRSFKQEAFKSQDKVQVRLPEDIDLQKCSLILYSQDKASWHIDGATRVSLAELAKN